MARKPARRLTAEEREATTAKEYGEKLHGDLLGPTAPTYKGETYLLCLRDEATDWPAVAPLKTKTAEENWAAFEKAVDVEKIKHLRTDLGGEFQGGAADACIAWKKGELQGVLEKAGLKRGGRNAWKGYAGDPFEFLPKWMSQNPLRDR